MLTCHVIINLLTVFHRAVCLRVHLVLLTDVSEERLQGQMIEVINKADLLGEFLESTDQKSLEHGPAASETGAESAVCATRIAERHLCEEGASPAASQDMRNCSICDEASRAEGLSIRAGDNEGEGSQESTASQARRHAQSGTSVHLPVDCESSKGGTAAPLDWCYDGQPRNINANIEWLRKQRMRCSSPPTVFTSVLTGQGLRDLMQEIEHMLRRQQGWSDQAEQMSLPGSEQKHGSPWTHKSPDRGEPLQCAHADDAHVRDLVGRAA